MARPFTTEDAQQLLARHNGLIQKLNSVDNYVIAYKKSVSSSVDSYLQNEAHKILTGIPVEELNRGKKGIRVKALRESGYECIDDLINTNADSLSDINGISYSGAQTITQLVDDIVERTMDGIKVSLSIDNKNPYTSSIVMAISNYRRSLFFAQALKKLRNVTQSDIASAMRDIEPGMSRWKWFIAPKNDKSRAVNAYNYLVSLEKSPYFRDSEAYLFSLENLYKTQPERAWEDFSENTVEFFNTLEDLYPGILGNDDSLYGLPEDLAVEVQKEAFYPNGLRCTLRRYQEWGVKYALHQEKVLLGDEMGLGKTVQAIAVMVSLVNTGATHFVVVCPASVLENWYREIQNKSTLKVTKVHGPNKIQELEHWYRNGGVAVTTYETTSIFNLPKNFKYQLLVVDEAHYVKNPKARRSQNVRALSGYTDRMLFMTGTALENKVDEMIELINFLKPNIASSVMGMEALTAAPLFRQKVAPVYYRRKREDVLTELPELIETEEWCSMNRIEEAKYEDDLLNGHYMTVRRVSWNVDDVRDSTKAKRLLEIVNEAKSEGRKILVFSFFLDTLKKVKTLLQNRCLEPINGSVPPYKRQQIIDEFDKAPPGTVLAAQIQSGGTGLNIQSASVVVICEPQFKPSTENQAISRAYRMGQSRNVLVYRLLSEGTIDERMMDLLENKQDIFNAFADKSVAYKKSAEIDDAMYKDIIQEEIDRINKKRGAAENNA